MAIEGYFDGTAVRPLESVNLKSQQKVFRAPRKSATKVALSFSRFPLFIFLLNQTPRQKRNARNGSSKR